MAKLWSTKTWSVTGELHGAWMHGAIAPDGRTVVLLGRDKKLHAACVGAQGQLSLAGEVPIPGDPVAIALGDGVIVAGFGDAPQTREAKIRVKCD